MTRDHQGNAPFAGGCWGGGRDSPKATALPAACHTAGSVTDHAASPSFTGRVSPISNRKLRKIPPLISKLHRLVDRLKYFRASAWFFSLRLKCRCLGSPVCSKYLTAIPQVLKMVRIHTADSFGFINCAMSTTTVHFCHCNAMQPQTILMGVQVLKKT